MASSEQRSRSDKLQPRRGPRNRVGRPVPPRPPSLPRNSVVDRVFSGKVSAGSAEAQAHTHSCRVPNHPPPRRVARFADEGLHPTALWPCPTSMQLSWSRGFQRLKLLCEQMPSRLPLPLRPQRTRPQRRPAMPGSSICWRS